MGRGPAGLPVRQRSRRLSKGNRVNIPEPGPGYHPGDGNVNEPQDAGGSPGKSSLFFLTIHDPGIRLTGDRVEELGKHFMSEVSGAFLTILENARERFIRTPGRTHNRIRSPIRGGSCEPRSPVGLVNQPGKP